MNYNADNFYIHDFYQIHKFFLLNQIEYLLLFDFLELKDIKIIRTTNKIFYLAANKYKDEFKFWCNRCEEGGYIDYESYYEYRRFNDIHKKIYKEYIRDVIIKEFDEYLCRCCRSKCSNCLTIKNRKNLKYKNIMI